jgi:hypothetical protein
VLFGLILGPGEKAFDGGEVVAQDDQAGNEKHPAGHDRQDQADDSDDDEANSEGHPQGMPHKINEKEAGLPAKGLPAFIIV